MLPWVLSYRLLRFFDRYFEEKMLQIKLSVSFLSFQNSGEYNSFFPTIQVLVYLERLKWYNP